MRHIFQNIWAVTKREVGRMFIRPLYIFASVGVMVLCTVFFLSIMRRGAPERMPVAIVDKDNTSVSQRLCHEFNVGLCNGVKCTASWRYPRASMVNW